MPSSGLSGRSRRHAASLPLGLWPSPVEPPVTPLSEASMAVTATPSAQAPGRVDLVVKLLHHAWTRRAPTAKPSTPPRRWSASHGASGSSTASSARPSAPSPFGRPSGPCRQSGRRSQAAGVPDADAVGQVPRRDALLARETRAGLFRSWVAESVTNHPDLVAAHVRSSTGLRREGVTHGATAAGEWGRVNRANPCPMCGHAETALAELERSP